MKLLTVYIIMLLFLSTGKTLAFPSEIIQAFRNGNITELSGILNSRIEVTIHNKENICDKKKAIELINAFLTTHTPTNFVVKHEGGKNNFHFAIATLYTVSGNFRIYFLMQADNEKQIINQIRIDNLNE